MQAITVALVIIAGSTYSSAKGAWLSRTLISRSSDEINARWVSDFQVLVYNPRAAGMRTSATKEVGRAWADRPCRYTLITLVTLCDVSPLFRESPPWDPRVNDAGVNVGIKPPQNPIGLRKGYTTPMNRPWYRRYGVFFLPYPAFPSPISSLLCLLCAFFYRTDVNLIRSGATLIPRRVHRPCACLVRSTGWSERRVPGCSGTRE